MAGLRSEVLKTGAIVAGLVALPFAAHAIPDSSDVPAGAPSQTAAAYDAAKEYQDGVKLLDEGKYAEAEAAFERAVFAAPKNADARFMQGVARQGKGELFPARVAFESALKFDENHIGAHRELGVTLAKMGNTVRAQEQLDYLKGRVASCADACPEKDDLAAAVKAVEAAIGGVPHAALERDTRLTFASAEAGDAAYLDAVGLINDGRYEEAIAHLEGAEKAFGPHPDVLTYLGFANRKLHRYGEAERWYAAALDAAPRHRGATEYLGELRVEQGNLPEARRLLARLEGLCEFGCVEADELRRWIDAAS